VSTKLADLVVREAILPELTNSERDGAVQELIDALIQAKAVPAKLRGKLVELILEREQKGSTGIGKGVAIPHVRHEKINGIIAAIGVSQQGIDFKSLDKGPVYSIVLLLSNLDKRDEHLQAMENIFSHLQKETFRRFLRQSTTVEEIEELIHEADTQQLQG